ncbi:hypothetical protein HYH03_008097 [Edaphochlamys debaryana]|uniref:Uncharacterized protein n=1 Tax=Edaphochlamys debaryana TaxID=47281 RepID=A0A835Y0C3_9CHLO|nr:hypothetical protein HYH03_008097 [Edaphochlamys debaryana]|eukprot:KAG2493578.1 hypothetical protein HYH03_008097 [Edaphochlamys debaryana]
MAPTPVASSVPAGARHVVLGKEHEHHPKDLLHAFEFESLVIVLVLIHAVAFLFFYYLLVKTRKPGPAKPKWGPDGKPVGAPARHKDSSMFQWRSPAEVLAAQKQKLGKV